ncbi:hypothetical protein AK812_SmicGene25178 [Symbiodinium microadriaticum]|uniref:Uncharacterized protein n=1 Tax=Symbiodinium microadriaticum TaxID=2951 RepID=A0A1Q9DCM8_SYMMI|nr:hypothetical protein AK812_SmicGene25178 [Symbiodinium microadriaticum]CAE7572710.1 unnamed protein product [Symbiodinium microadriaticum]
MPTPTSNLPDLLGLQQDVALLRDELRQEVEELTGQLRALEARVVEVARRGGAGGKAGGWKEDPTATANAEDAGCSSMAVMTVVQEEEEDEDPGQVGEVRFGESAWTFPVLLGLTPSGAWDVAFSLMLLLLNLGMQVMFSYIILGSSFMGSEFAEEIQAARRWRIGSAHDYRYLDSTQTSLASRVCTSDGALILSTVQATVVNHINSFLGLEVYQFEPGPFQPGVLLCLLCILLWSFCVYKEFRSIFFSVEAVWRLPRSMRTEYRDNSLHSLSKGRFHLVLVSFMIRIVIATVLLLAGISWLARTTSITELMLNAVALNAILDVDEWLFAGFTPVSVELAVKNLEPIKVKYSRLRSQLEAVVLFLLLVATLLLPYIVLLQPLGETMKAVKWELKQVGWFGKGLEALDSESRTERLQFLLDFGMSKVGAASAPAFRSSSSHPGVAICGIVELRLASRGALHRHAEGTECLLLMGSGFLV